MVLYTAASHDLTNMICTVNLTFGRFYSLQSLMVTVDLDLHTGNYVRETLQPPISQKAKGLTGDIVLNQVGAVILIKVARRA